MEAFAILLDGGLRPYVTPPTTSNDETSGIWQDGYLARPHSFSCVLTIAPNYLTREPSNWKQPSEKSTLSRIVFDT